MKNNATGVDVGSRSHLVAALSCYSFTLKQDKTQFHRIFQLTTDPLLNFANAAAANGAIEAFVRAAAIELEDGVRIMQQALL